MADSFQAAGTFDAWGSAVLGGLVGAAVALLTVFVAQHLQDRRQAAVDRAQLANEISGELSELATTFNLLDSAAGRTLEPAKINLGTWRLVSMKARLARWDGGSSFAGVLEEYMNKVGALHMWFEDHPPNARTPTQVQQLSECVSTLGRWSTNLAVEITEFLHGTSTRKTALSLGVVIPDW